MTGVDLEVAMCEALFVSALRCGGSIPAVKDAVHDAIRQSISDLGLRECAAQVAQEFGDHPDTAVSRMRWARRAVAQAFAAGSGGAPPCSAAVSLGRGDRPLGATVTGVASS